MKALHALRPLAASALAAALLLAGCGGGGGGDSATPVTPPSSRFGASASYANMCTVDGQKQFVRAYLDEVYLWYSEVPEVNAANYATVPEYFNALLVRAPDANGVPRDRFSAILTTSAANAALGQDFGLQAFDPQAQSATLGNSVPVAKVVTSPGGRRTGYILFVDHNEGAQDQLITAFRQVRDGGAQDLVLDLRYNGGGFLYVALAAASMVTGPADEGRVFEQLRYNAKRTAETSASFLHFSSLVQFAETQNARGTALPQLGLKRLYVLTSGQTCSSSESIINSLRGIDVQVILVGSTTCGKPYGFTRKDNCGYSLFPIEFQGFNAKGFGDYTAGFTPTCQVADNPATAPGSASDPLLTAALTHVDTGNCPFGTARSQLLKSADPQAATRPVNPRPAWAGRLLRER